MKPNFSPEKQNRQIKEGLFEVWKERGETLASLLKRFRNIENFKKEIPITYAGRLDPMAEGVVLILVGQMRFEKEKYMSMEKQYEFKVLFGVATDTYDVLGRIESVSIKEIEKNKLHKVIEEIKKVPLPYPPFSSKTVKGKPLFSYARDGESPDIFPIQSGVPKSLEMISEEDVLLKDLINKIIDDIKRVDGDFRQAEIIEGWEKLKNQDGDSKFSLVTFKATVPSGVYIRSIAHHIGQEVGVPGLAYSITRVKIINEFS